MSQVDPCLFCPHRLDDKVSALVKASPSYNPFPFCEIGYKQNPKSAEALHNSLINNAEVCNRLRLAFSPPKERILGLLRPR